jgi:hypothetical protein
LFWLFSTAATLDYSRIVGHFHEKARKQSLLDIPADRPRATRHLASWIKYRRTLEPRIKEADKNRGLSVCEAPMASWPAFLPEALATAANASSEMVFNFSA